MNGHYTTSQFIDYISRLRDLEGALDRLMDRDKGKIADGRTDIVEDMETVLSAYEKTPEWLRDSMEKVDDRVVGIVEAVGGAIEFNNIMRGLIQ